MAFCLDSVTQGTEFDFISKQELRIAYNKYRKKHNLPLGAGDKEIKATLQDMFAADEGRKEINEEWIYIWKGIKWKPDPKDLET